MTLVPPTCTKFVPLKVFVPARLSNVGGVLLLRQVVEKFCMTVIPPLVPFNCRLPTALVPELFRKLIGDATLARAALEVIWTAPSLAVVLLESRFNVPARELFALRTRVPGPFLVKPLV